MKVLTTTGLTKLIDLIKSSFISVNDTIETQESDLKTINGQSILGSGNIEIQASPDLDNVTITTNTDDELQAIALIDEGDNTAKKERYVTQAQYDAMKEAGTLDSNTYYNTPQDATLTLLEVLFPVGALYFGNMTDCPLATLGIGIWEALPQDKVLQIAGTRGSVGTTLEESLPNIKGTFSNTIWADTEAVATGALEVTVGDIANRPAASSGQAFRGFNLDASRSSSTYQDNAPVQPNAYLINGWIRIS